MLSTIGRTAIRRVGGGASISTNRALQSLWFAQRANTSETHDSAPSLKQFAYALQRCYATATKTVAKPKTTRAKTTTTAVKRKSATAKTAKPKKKPAAKKKKAAPKKRKVAAKKKVVKKKAKKDLTEAQKLKAEIKQLKIKGLVAEEPKQLPSTAWRVIVTQESKDATGSITLRSKSIADKWKASSPSEVEALNHTANANKKANEVALKKWVESHTPAEINDANNARRLLQRRTGSSRSFKLLKDDRLPKRPTTAYLHFVKARHASGDLKGVGTFAESAKLIFSDWKNLSPSEKKQYEDLEKAEKARYIQEYKTVFGKDSSAKLS